MKRNSLFVLIAMLMNFTVKSQPSLYFKSYDVNTKADFTQTSDMILCNDSSYAIALNSYDSTLMSSTIELIKIDTGGHITWGQSFICNSYCYNTQLIQMPDSGFLISSTYYYQADTTDKILLIKTNKFGIKQWIKLLGDGSLSQINRGLGLSGNDIFILSSGIRELSGTNVEHDYFIAKLDLTGNIVWHKYFNWAGAPYPKTLLVTPQKEMYVSGTVLYNGISQMGFSKIDSSGNLLLSKIFNTIGSVEPLDILIDSSNIILTGRTGSYGAGLLDGFIMKLDASANFISAKTFGDTLDDEGYSIFKAHTSGYVICAEPESFGHVSRASLIKTDTAGNMQWMKIYGDTAGSFPNGALQLNNGYLIYGIKGTYSSFAPIYLLKTDTSGIASCKWSTVTIPTSSFSLTTIDTGVSGTVQGNMTYTLTENIKVINEFDECPPNSINDLLLAFSDLIVYPNPFSSSISITINKTNIKNVTFKVYDILGQKVFSKEENNFKSSNVKTIDLSLLSKGIYLLEVNVDGERTAKKIVKE
jgi:hypothetical protein